MCLSSDLLCQLKFEMSFVSSALLDSCVRRRSWEGKVFMLNLSVPPFGKLGIICVTVHLPWLDIA